MPDARLRQGSVDERRATWKRGIISLSRLRYIMAGCQFFSWQKLKKVLSVLSGLPGVLGVRFLCSHSITCDCFGVLRSVGDVFAFRRTGSGFCKNAFGF